MVKRRFSIKRRFWTWRKVALAIILSFIAVNAYLTSTYTEPSSFAKVSYPIVIGNIPVQTGYYPINRSAVTLFAKDLLSDYNVILAINETGKAGFSIRQPYFFLYRPSGSFEVEVAKESASFGDRLEFLFIPIQSVDLKVSVFTNETADYLRPLAGTTLSPNRLTIAPFETPYGVALYDYTTVTALGETLIPLVWITNSSFVYGNVALNANNAAREIYRENLQAISHELNPPYPSWGWWVIVGRFLLDKITYWLFIVGVGVVGYVAFYWQVQDRKGKQSGQASEGKA